MVLRNTQTHGITLTNPAVTNLYDMLMLPATFGGTADTAVTNTTAGGTNIQMTKTAGGATVGWISPPFPQAVTITTGTMSAWLHESNMNNNAGGRVSFYRWQSGTTATAISPTFFNFGTEASVTNPREDIWATDFSPDQAFNVGDRLVLLLFVTNVGTMAVATGGFTLTFNAPAGTTGDSFFELADTVTHPPRTLSVSDSLTVIDGGATAERWIEVSTVTVVIESAGAPGTLTPSVSDALTVIDAGATAILKPLILSVSDVSTVIDAGAMAVLQPLRLTVSEVTTVADVAPLITLGVVPMLSCSVSDALTLVDGGATARLSPLLVSASEAVTLVDAGATLRRSIAVTASDDVVLAELSAVYITGTVPVDTFNDNTQNLLLWDIGTINSTTDPLVTVNETAQQLQITLRTNSPAANAYNGYVTDNTYNLTNLGIFIEVPQVAGVATSAQTQFFLYSNATNFYVMTQEAGDIAMTKVVAGSGSDTFVTYNAANHRWWRIRHVSAGNTIRFDTSANGVTWNEQRSTPADVAVTALRIAFQAGTYEAVVAPGVAIFDNFNFVPPTNVLFIGVTDAITATDVGATARLTHEILDVLTVGDLAPLVLLQPLRLTSSDVVTLVDAGATVTRAVVAVVSIDLSASPESMTLAEVAPRAVLQPLRVSASDVTTLVDAGATTTIAVAAVVSINLSASPESITLAEITPLAVLQPLRLSASEVTTLVDVGATAQLTRLLVAASESLTLTDAGASVQLVQGLSISVSDQLTLVDVAPALQLRPLLLQVSEVLTASELAPTAVLQPLRLSASDTATLVEVEADTLLQPLRLTASEAVTLVDGGATLQLVQTLRPTATDALTVADVAPVVRLSRLLLSVSDGLTLVDVVPAVRLTKLLVSVTDVVAFVDVAPLMFSGYWAARPAADGVTLAEFVLVQRGAVLVTIPRPDLRVTAAVRDLTVTSEVSISAVTAALRDLLQEAEPRPVAMIAARRDLSVVSAVSVVSVTAEVRDLTKVA